jgi:hypothetical protein
MKEQFKEQFRPQPENPKQHAPEAGSGSIGVSPPTPEHSPQGNGNKSPEREPRPDVWEFLERRERYHDWSRGLEAGGIRLTRDSRNTIIITQNVRKVRSWRP